MKATALITARLKSERLPAKALRVLGRKPVIGHLLDRLNETSAVSEVILCTSNLEADLPLVEWAKAQRIKVFQGDPDDVILRLANASQLSENSTLACVTADNPFVDSSRLGQLIAFHCQNAMDYTRSQGVPIGCYGYVLARSALLKVAEEKQTKATEIWGPLFLENAAIRCGSLSFPANWESLLPEEPRLTIDTPEDWSLAEKIESTLRSEGRQTTLEQILEVLSQHPHWLQLNRHVVQRQAPHLPQLRT